MAKGYFTERDFARLKKIGDKYAKLADGANVQIDKLDDIFDLLEKASDEFVAARDEIRDRLYRETDRETGPDAVNDYAEALEEVHLASEEIGDGLAELEDALTANVSKYRTVTLTALHDMTLDSKR